MQIKLTFGAVQIEYDGSEEYFTSTVPTILEKLAKLGGTTSPPKGTSANGAGAPDGARNNHDGVLNHSTNTVAKLLDAKTGPDLIMAAVGKLVIVDGAEKVTRNQITAEMRAASAYYKKTYTNNLSKYLDTLTKADQLRLMGENVYGLPAKQRDQLEAKLHE